MSHRKDNRDSIYIKRERETETESERDTERELELENFILQGL